MRTFASSAVAGFRLKCPSPLKIAPVTIPLTGLNMVSVPVRNWNVAVSDCTLKLSRRKVSRSGGVNLPIGRRCCA